MLISVISTNSRNLMNRSSLVSYTRGGRFQPFLMTNIFTVCNSSCRKVMFLHLSIILSTAGGGVCLWVQGVVSLWIQRGQPLGPLRQTPRSQTPRGRHPLGRHPPGRYPTPWQTPPRQTHPRDSHCS